jgi:hypothetical protein
MKKFLSVLAVGLMAGAVYAGNDIRFFFDTLGVGEGESRTPSADVLNYTNPSEVGSARFYLYAEFLEANTEFLGVDMNIRVDGAGSITDWHIYNAAGAAGDRWNGIGNATGPGPVTRIESIAMVNVNAFGLKNDVLAELLDTNHYRKSADDGGSTAGTTLMGWIDVMNTGGGDAEVFMEVGPLLMASVGATPDDLVYFGYGDDPVGQQDAGASSTLADATVTPEPTSLALLGLGVLALRRRR